MIYDGKSSAAQGAAPVLMKVTSAMDRLQQVINCAPTAARQGQGLSKTFTSLPSGAAQRNWNSHTSYRGPSSIMLVPCALGESFRTQSELLFRFDESSSDDSHGSYTESYRCPGSKPEFNVCTFYPACHFWSRQSSNPSPERKVQTHSIILPQRQFTVYVS